MAEYKGIQDKCYHSETYLNKTKLNQNQQLTFSNLHLPPCPAYRQIYTWVIILRVADLTLLSPNPASFIVSFLSFSLDLLFPPLLCVFVTQWSSIILSPLIMLEYSVHSPVRIYLRKLNIPNTITRLFYTCQNLYLIYKENTAVNGMVSVFPSDPLHAKMALPDSQFGNLKSFVW